MRSCAECGLPFSPIRREDKTCQRCVRPSFDFTAGRLIVVRSDFPREYDPCLKALSREGFILTRPHETAVESDWLARLFILADEPSTTAAALLQHIDSMRPRK